MTETEWDACSDPVRMLEFLRVRGTASDRKLRLFACACCRRIWDRFPDPCNRDLVAAVEDHPDGSFHDPELEAALVASSRREGEFRDEPAYWAAKYLGRGFYKTTAAESAFTVASKVMLMAGDGQRSEGRVGPEIALHDPIGGNRFRPPSRWPAAVAAEAKIQAALLRDVFGPLAYRPVSIPPAVRTWHDGTVAKLAAGIYEGRRFGDLSVLADALEEAGCTDAELLGHLHGPGPHVLGCWTLDLLLEKS